MKLHISKRTAWTLRALAVVALLALLLVGANSFALAKRLRPDFIADHTGVYPLVPAQLDIFVRNHAATVFGDDLVFSLRTAPGQVSPPAFAPTFPLYPGAVAQRSAVYRQPVGGIKPDRVLRGAVYAVPATARATIEWYRKELTAQGWELYHAPVAVQPAALQGTKGMDSFIRVELEQSPSNIRHCVIGVYVSGE
jgi:hypothetical protein